jgi:hypothetical protein
MALNNPKKYYIQTGSNIEINRIAMYEPLFQEHRKTSEMMRKSGLEADSEIRRVILLQGFATRSLQFNIFLTAIIWLFTAEASIKFSHRKKTLRPPH